MNEKHNKLIVALDVADANAALRIVNQLRGLAAMFKVGSQLFTAAGPDLVRSILAKGERVFLDLKFHDIPNTVAAAGSEAVRLGVSMFNVHAGGGTEMMRRTVDAVNETAAKETVARPVIIAVTVLTSSNSTTLAEMGVSLGPRDLVCRLASLAEESGLDGVVASPLEARAVRSVVRNPRFVIVTPGVRPRGTGAGDQKRVTTPGEAVAAGADYLVVGRPILDAPDPLVAAQAILGEIASIESEGVSTSAGT